MLFESTSGFNYPSLRCRAIAECPPSRMNKLGTNQTGRWYRVIGKRVGRKWVSPLGTRPIYLLGIFTHHLLLKISSCFDCSREVEQHKWKNIDGPRKQFAIKNCKSARVRQLWFAIPQITAGRHISNSSNTSFLMKIRVLNFVISNSAIVLRDAPFIKKLSSAHSVYRFGRTTCLRILSFFILVVVPFAAFILLLLRQACIACKFCSMYIVTLGRDILFSNKPAILLFSFLSFTYDP